MGSCLPTIKQADFAKQKGTSTHAGVDACRWRNTAQPIDQQRVVHLPARAPTPWRNEQIERWMVFKGVVRLNQQITARVNKLLGLGNGQHFDRADLPFPIRALRKNFSGD